MTTALPSALNPTYMLTNLAAETGEAVGKYAKAGRDGWELERLRSEIAPELGDICWQLAGACEVLGLNLQDVAEANLAKLADRANRGKIAGSGDTR
jgi:NTP pyrophosphatase (non-canonical NTP hydrolase)